MNLFKKISVVLIITLIHQFIITSATAQTPDQFKYQAVLRNADGTIMANEAVTVDISILKGSASGTSVFTEQHSVTTTAQGLINLNIGSVSDLSVVDFSADTYFIEISVNSTVMGTSQLLSVPYALQAKNVENVDYSQITNTPTIDGSETKVTAGTNVTVTGTGTSGDPYVVNSTAGGSATHYVGELYGGGVVFWVDNTGDHGLIVSMVDISTSQAWSDVTNVTVPGGALSDWDGQTNSTNIIAQSTATSAADICDSYTNADYGTGIYSDWYLPSIAELNHVWNNIYEVQKAIDSDGNGATTAMVRSYYWSSSESYVINAWRFNFYNGVAYPDNKSNTSYVRGVRAF